MASARAVLRERVNQVSSSRGRGFPVAPRQGRDPI